MYNYTKSNKVTFDILKSNIKQSVDAGDDIKINGEQRRGNHRLILEKVEVGSHLLRH